MKSINEKFDILFHAKPLTSGACFNPDSPHCTCSRVTHVASGCYIGQNGTDAEHCYSECGPCQRKHTGTAREKRLIITNHQGNANQNHTETSPHTCQNSYCQKDKQQVFAKV